ncbi:MAG TPA: hypothetical protein VFW22_07735 [Pseudolabrys sp.]|nr:hypothetical protein [Pseudolabrys sp.]
MKRLLAVLLIAGSTAVSAVHAAEADALFQDFALFGTWATDCKAPASPGNPHVSIRTAAPGVVLEEHDLGPGYAHNRYSMLSAERLSAQELSVETIFQPGAEVEERQKLVFLARDGTRRTMFNQRDNGPVRVKDGVVLARNTPTPVLHKCE